MGKGQIFFDIQLQYHLICKMVLQLNGIKFFFFLILSNRFNPAISLSSLIFSLSFLSLPSLFLIPSLSLAIVKLLSFSPNHQAHFSLRITKPGQSSCQTGAHMLSPCRSPVSWVVLPWVLQIADVVVLPQGLWFCRGFLGSALCVCVFFFLFGGSCSGYFSWLLVVIFGSFFGFFFFSLSGFCGGCFLWWLLLVVGLVVF